MSAREIEFIETAENGRETVIVDIVRETEHDAETDDKLAAVREQFRDESTDHGLVGGFMPQPFRF